MIWAAILLALGLGLILAEVFIPSMGILSVLATACIVGSLVMAFTEGNAVGVRFLVVTALLVPTSILLGLKYFPRSPFGKYMVAPGLSFEAQTATDARDRGLLGARGVVVSDLRPAGFARLAGRRVDVVSRGESIEKGAEVVVTDVRGNRVVVARVEPDTDQQSQTSPDDPA